MWQKWRRARNAKIFIIIIITLWNFCSCTPDYDFLSTAADHRPPALDITRKNVQPVSAAGQHLSDEQSLCSKGCQCTSSSIQCVNLGLTEVPGLPQKVASDTVISSLVLSGNNFTSLGDGFKALRSLNSLVLRNNSINMLEPSTFQGLINLKTLDLSRNQLRAMPSDALESCYRLIHLDLSRNCIEEIDNSSFSTLIHLETLDLSWNSISFIASNTFQNLVQLNSLNLSNNHLSVLHMSMLRGMTNLATLSVINNTITSIEAKTFQHATNLSLLSLSSNLISLIDPRAFDGLHQLTHLNLSHNKLSQFPAQFTLTMPALTHLNLAENPIMMLNQSQFAPGRALEEIVLSNMPYLTTVHAHTFAGLSSLVQINLSDCPQFKYINPNTFRGCSSLEEVDLSNSGLRTLHSNLIKQLPKLRYIYLQNNNWHCDCSLQWLSVINETRPELLIQGPQVECAKPSHLAGRSVFDAEVYHENCSSASITHYYPNVNFRIGSAALLECHAAGDPLPSITWFTPRNHILHWYPQEVSDGTSLASGLPHISFHHSADSPPTSQRLQVLSNGNLFISPVETVDAGMYICLADNSLGNHSVGMLLTLDYEILMHVKIVSILVGLATSVAFLLTMLVVQLIHMILNRWGWCCCRGKLPPKAKKIRKMLESVEHYKKQQLERLRENYNLQVQRIKDNGTQQMEWLRESYSSQTERLRDIRDYGTLQIDRMRDQYYEQVRRVRDYSVQQMSRVRENYVFQRNRIRKFSAHQLFKLRENYKIQQMHLNKILENLNLESCRTVCARTDSVMFTSEITMDPCFVSGIHPSPVPLDGMASSGDSTDFNLPELGPESMMLPPGLEEFEMQHFPLSLVHGDPESDESVCSLPIPTLDCEVSTNQRAKTLTKGEVYVNTTVEADLEEIVTCIVDPSSSPKMTPQKETNVVNV